MAFNPSTLEAEASGFLSLRLAWSTQLSCRTARATQRNPVSRKQTKKLANQTKHGLNTPFIMEFTSVGKEKFWKRGLRMKKDPR